MDCEYVTAWESGIDYVAHIDGESWYTRGTRWSRWRKLLPHRHVAQTRGIVNGLYVERCPCGAYGPRPWVRL